MPLYDYECQDCGVFTELRSIDGRDAPLACPHCEQPTRRIVSAPNLAVLSPANRKAHAINERSQHAPTVRRAHQCGSGCGCGKKGIDVVGTAKKNALGKFQAGSAASRPWMLGH